MMWVILPLVLQMAPFIVTSKIEFSTQVYIGPTRYLCFSDENCHKRNPTQDPCTLQCVSLTCRTVPRIPWCNYCRDAMDCVNSFGIACYRCIDGQCTGCLPPGVTLLPVEDTLTD